MAQPWTFVNVRRILWRNGRTAGRDPVLCHLTVGSEAQRPTPGWAFRSSSLHWASIGSLPGVLARLIDPSSLCCLIPALDCRCRDHDPILAVASTSSNPRYDQMCKKLFTHPKSATAGERTRTSTSLSGHQDLNLARLPIPPRPRTASPVYHTTQARDAAECQARDAAECSGAADRVSATSDL